MKNKIPRSGILPQIAFSDNRIAFVSGGGIFMEQLKRRKKNQQHGLTNTKLYNVWRNMKRRCASNNPPSFKYYRLRGITVWEEWEFDCMKFFDWAMKNGYKEGLELDRINNNGNYTPENCRFVTKSENLANSRLIRSNNTTGYRGVYLVKGEKKIKYRAHANIGKKHTSLGFFNTKEDAARAYNDFIIKNHPNHPLNIIYKK